MSRDKCFLNQLQPDDLVGDFIPFRYSYIYITKLKKHR